MLRSLQERFAKDRDWEKHHTPRNIGKQPPPPHPHPQMLADTPFCLAQPWPWSGKLGSLRRYFSGAATMGAASDFPTSPPTTRSTSARR